MAREAFAVWITGLPAAGKSTLTKALRDELTSRGIDVAVLESDELRRILTPAARYDERERDTFYRQMIWIGALLVTHGVPVIFDATANRRIWRRHARETLPRFVEVFVDCSLKVCMARDPKGIYRRARAGEASTVPGFQSDYEPPEHAEIVVRDEAPEEAASCIVGLLAARRYIP